MIVRRLHAVRTRAHRLCRRQHARVALALIAGATVLAYLPSFQSPFQFDDFNDIATPYFYLTAPRTLIQRYPTRWIPYLTLLANANLPRLQWRYWRPAELVWYHVINWLAHVGVAWLMYLLSIRLIWLMQRRRIASAGGLSARGTALAASLFFGLHPMLAQTVIYLSQRATLFMALCYMGTLLCVAGTLTGRSRREWQWLGAAAWLAAGIFCKETIISAPAAATLLVLLFRQPHRRVWHWRRTAVWVLGVCVVCAAPVVLFLHLSRWHMPTVLHNLRSVGGPLHAHTPGLTRITYAITQITVIGRYLLLAVWPRGLSVDHDVPLMTALWQWPVLGWGALLAGLALLAWRWRARAPLFAWGYGFFLIAVLPQSSIVPTPDLMLEYRTYPALAGVAWMGAALYGIVFSAAPRRRWRWSARVLVIAALALCGVLTWGRSRIWRSDVTLWYDAWRRAPHKQRPANNLANALLQRNDTDGALAVIQRTIMSSTNALPQIYGTLGTIYASRGHYDAATNAYVISLLHDWSNRDVRYNLSLVYARMGLRQAALDHLRWLGHVYPDYADSWLLLGALCSDDPHLFDSATNAFTRYLRLVPDGPGADTARAALERLQQAH